MKKAFKLLGVLCALLLLVSALSACGGGGSTSSTAASNETTSGSASGSAATAAPTEPAQQEPKEIDILAITFTGTPAAADEPTIKALEELTGYKVKVDFLLNSSLEDQLNTRMASGDLPALVVLPGKTASVISNCRAGAFWDITDFYRDYPNLAKANEMVMNNISIDGRIYGIYRARPLGRNGISIRKDWLENLGLPVPKTLDELYNVLYAFKNDDPDKNGKDDTYGMTWCKWYGPLDQLAVAFGAPNKWGEGPDGKLIPMFGTPEYMESMKYAKKLYDEGLVNKDFAALETSDWILDFNSSKSGVHIDVSDQARRSQQYFINEKQMPDGIVTVIGMVEGPKGRRVMPTSGHAGFVAVSKNGAPAEQDMKDALAFLDMTNTKEGQNILNYGVEGVHYDLNDKGEVVARKFDQDPREGLNQFMTNVVDGLLLPTESTAIQKEINQVQADNIQYCIGNPAEPLTSNTYSEKGAQLDQMISDARVQFIVGQLDEAGFNAVVDQWYSQGGQQVADEFTAAYQATKK